MKRRTFDRIVSMVGFGLSIFLFVAGALLNWGYSFADNAVKTQLSNQKIMFPAADSAGLMSLPDEDRAVIEKYAGQQLVTGKQAMAYADHYIGVHLKNIGGGKTYNEVSGEALAAQAAAAANPSDASLAAKAAALGNQRTTLFMGETLKGLLGNAYAFWQLGQIAMYSAYAAVFAGILMLVLSILGFMHLRRTSEDATV
jgi:hypothetical protein